MKKLILRLTKKQLYLITDFVRKYRKLGEDYGLLSQPVLSRETLEILFLGEKDSKAIRKILTDCEVKTNQI